MKLFRYFIILATFVASISCVQSDVDVQVGAGADQIRVVGYVSSFSERNVSSRAFKVGDEGNTVSMCLAVFSSSDICKQKIYQPSGNAAFTLDKKELENGDKLYIFANIANPLKLDKGNMLSDFLALQNEVTTVDMPKYNGTRCFPMWGVLEIPDVSNIDPILQIPLQAIYAKIVVNILSKPDQKVDGKSPASFSLTKYEVHNVAQTVDFVGGTSGTTDDGVDIYDDDVVFEGSNITSDLAQADKQASFYFYLPERYVKPSKTPKEFSYPFGSIDGLDEDELKKLPQRYKPVYAKETCDPAATFVRFFGEYIDHQGHNWNVSYDIYVGKDNYSNFDIEANTQYNNNVTIRGISKSNDGKEGTISVDHRVGIERISPIIVNLQRETLLDSHFEVRPLRIRKNPAFTGNTDNAKVKVEVVYNNDDATKNWIGIERSFGDGVYDATESNIYLVDGDLATGRKNAAGKRKYFTTDLTTSTLSGKTVEIPVTKAGETVWVYVDECTTAGDDVRSATIRLSYSEDGENYIEGASTEYVLNQRMLFPVTYGSNTYHIEYHEEYLHNYDADDSYGQTEYEGMQWGLPGVPLSKSISAIMICNGNQNSITSKVKYEILSKANPQPYYDFYLSRDIVESYWYFTSGEYNNLVHNYNGYEFTKKIIGAANVGVLSLAQDATSAAEYCYNKNKRDEDGNVVLTDDKGWYLPAIDEIEEIVKSKYDGNYYSYARFSDFQNKFYWSSQPAYRNNYIDVLYKMLYLGNASRYGIYMSDNTDLARATKVNYIGGNPNEDSNYHVVDSGLKNLMHNDDSEDTFSNGIFTAATLMAHNYISITCNQWTGDIDEIDEYPRTNSDGKFSRSNGKGSWTHYLIEPEYSDGARSRTSMARVRCVRKMN